jgi:hypothetical protein
MLTLVTPTQMSPARQRVQVYVWTGVIFIIFSILISLFRIKNRGATFKFITFEYSLMQFDCRISIQTSILIGCKQWIDLEN